jgi:HPt (histidine-containing phosphotransfer) domain-containing protein
LIARAMSFPTPLLPAAPLPKPLIGRIEAQSLPGRGSTFWSTATFPWAAAASANAAGSTLPTHAPGALDVIRGARILLVEDNPLNQQVAAGMLEHVGATVRTADNGQEALAHGDLPALADLGHRLKSSSKMVGAMGFAAMCQSLEELTPDASGPAQLCSEGLRLSRLLCAVSQALRFGDSGSAEPWTRADPSSKRCLSCWPRSLPILARRWHEAASAQSGQPWRAHASVRSNRV